MNNNREPDDENYAVSPRDLSLRLHEVIQSRLEARIMELEAELRNNQRRPTSMGEEFVISAREMYSEAGSLSTQESPVFVEDEEGKKKMQTFDGELSLCPNDEDDDDEGVVGERWPVRDKIRSWEELTSRSWGSNDDDDDDEEEEEDDEMGKLLIKQIVEKTRQGSAAVLNAQRMLYSLNGI